MINRAPEQNPTLLKIINQNPSANNINSQCLVRNQKLQYMHINKKIRCINQNKNQTMETQKNDISDGTSRKEY